MLYCLACELCHLPGADYTVVFAGVMSGHDEWTLTDHAIVLGGTTSISVLRWEQPWFYILGVVTLVSTLMFTASFLAEA